ncbi:DUF1097 domain-containing protein [Methyloversatilis sp.]|uniref:DUF1097 domain-containing protein n=1 Tax=Methyloversatilis sp. TaxID=2569862 RepID=UPI000BDC25E4|nr:DUF1097 domain-containing protein [Methyloversatilis sp.]OYW25555.1 MAG: hypothetical protein B7Z51_11045 [Methyloversatilis sp. 12-65-5]MDP2868889.1 DUF1097 domain-containing protein [Methyloversatilis sp.]MDP3287858.1 DUF1097 domain-containing protein [Methyloversatilis sp.]MDP3454048.1 DUF1097 domain-containing protein [Methyloversatilis sp.]MDP3578034.1 DUF1097 domain-containing protein [Methyloversatilis sp.]
MKPLAALTCANVILAVVMTFSMQSFTLPLWPMVIAWAGFFHLGGSDHPPTALAAVLAHAVFGVFAGWLAALAILFNPTALPGTVWVPLVVGAAVGVMSLASGWPRLAVLPVCVYGFAANWAYLDVPGRFDPAVLTALRADNVIVALPLALLIGGLFGWANAKLIAQLSAPAARPLP